MISSRVNGFPPSVKKYRFLFVFCYSDLFNHCQKPWNTSVSFQRRIQPPPPPSLGTTLINYGKRKREWGFWNDIFSYNEQVVFGKAKENKKAQRKMFGVQSNLNSYLCWLEWLLLLDMCVCLAYHALDNFFFQPS